MWPIATDIACSMVCGSLHVLVTWVSCAKTAILIEMLFSRLTPVDAWNHVLDGGQDLTNSFATASSDKMVMRPFSKLLWTLVTVDTAAAVVFLLPLSFIIIIIIITKVPSDDSDDGS